MKKTDTIETIARTWATDITTLDILSEDYVIGPTTPLEVVEPEAFAGLGDLFAIARFGWTDGPNDAEIAAGWPRDAKIARGGDIIIHAPTLRVAWVPDDTILRASA